MRKKKIIVYDRYTPPKKNIQRQIKKLQHIPKYFIKIKDNMTRLVSVMPLVFGLGPMCVVRPNVLAYGKRPVRASTVRT